MDQPRYAAVWERQIKASVTDDELVDAALALDHTKDSYGQQLLDRLLEGRIRGLQDDLVSADLLDQAEYARRLAVIAGLAQARDLAASVRFEAWLVTKRREKEQVA
jgi:hypothetical protein